MINWEHLRDELQVKTGVAYYDSRKTELICRCPKCEKDSQKNKGHLYIRVDDESPVFNCFKCGFKGNIMTLIKFLSLNKDDIIQGDIPFSYIKSISDNRSAFLSDKFFFERIDDCIDNYRLKVQYLKQRIGYNLNLELIPNLVLGVKNFIRINNINVKHINTEFLEFLDRNFVGFVCNRETMMILRNTDYQSDFRFYTLKLRDTSSFFKDFYGLRTNHYDEEKINTIVLCEGIFDVLVSYFSNHFDDLKEESFFWACALNNSYDNTAISVLDFCKLTRANFVILSDMDVKEHRYSSLSKKPYINNLTIYWNKAGKDFGKLPIEKIKTSFNRNFFNKKDMV
jgi:hypothetical protein